MINSTRGTTPDTKVSRKVYVWTFLTRAFHWIMSVMILLLFITGEEDSLIIAHVALGVSIGVLILFRFVFGYLGVKYSDFGDFNLTLKKATDYATKLLSSKKKAYLGHNPLAGFLMILILLVIMGSVISGMLAYGEEDGRGIFASLYYGGFRDMELFEELHEGIATFLLVLIGLHLVGVFFDLLVNRGISFYSIFNGYKNGHGDDARLSWEVKLFGFVWLALTIIILIYVLSNSRNVFIADKQLPVNYETVHEDFYNECASCHTLYPPYLLPALSWKNIMNNLENHFGDDASVEPSVNKSITRFLLKNSAETSYQKGAIKVLSSLRDKSIIAITKTPYWKNSHKDIDDKVFKGSKVKSQANCLACHSDIERGKIERENVKYIASLGYFLDK